MKSKISLLSFIFVFLIFGPLLAIQKAEVEGEVISRKKGVPAPGLKISLVHPELGRSAIAVTDIYGKFKLFDIPLVNTPYYMEIYWGKTIIYREKVKVNNVKVVLPTIYI